MAQSLPHHYSYADYLALEADANVKHEFFEGRIYGMAGGSLDHAALAMAVGNLLRTQLAGRACRVFSSDARVRVLATGLATYPDVSVVCGAVERDPESRHTLVNPIVLVEVLSESTKDYDRGEKFEHYRRIPSLRAYVFVDAATLHVELRTRREDATWEITTASDGERVVLDALGCVLEVDEIYRDGLLGA